MASRSPGQKDLRTAAGTVIGSTDALSRWRSRLGTVATTLVEMFHSRPIPATVRVTAHRERRSYRR